MCMYFGKIKKVFWCVRGFKVSTNIIILTSILISAFCGRMEGVTGYSDLSVLQFHSAYVGV